MNWGECVADNSDNSVKIQKRAGLSLSTPLDDSYENECEYKNKQLVASDTKTTDNKEEKVTSQSENANTWELFDKLSTHPGVDNRCRLFKENINKPPHFEEPPVKVGCTIRSSRIAMNTEVPPTSTESDCVGARVEMELNNMKEVTNDELMLMLQKILSDVGTVKTDVTSLRTDCNTEITRLKVEKKVGDEKITLLENKQKSNANLATSNKKDVTHLKKQVQRMAEVIERQSQVIDELAVKIERAEKSKMRPNIIIKGIIENEGENCETLVQSFVKNKLEITEGISTKKAYRIGKGKDRPILVVLENPGDKGKIYSHVKLLQDKKNIKQKPFQVDDELPARQREQRTKFKDLMW